MFDVNLSTLEIIPRVLLSSCEVCYKYVRSTSFYYVLFKSSLSLLMFCPGELSPMTTGINIFNYYCQSLPSIMPVFTSLMDLKVLLFEYVYNYYVFLVNSFIIIKYNSSLGHLGRARGKGRSKHPAEQGS